MKKILLSLIFLISITSIKSATPDSLNKTQIYNDFKSLYKDDLRDIVKYSVNKADTLLTKGYRIISVGAAHTYDILKKQQLVKSINYLFYSILSLLLIFIIINRIKSYNNDPSKFNEWLLFGVIAVDICLSIYNISNFNEMLTGFINPEYGAIQEIITYMSK